MVLAITGSRDFADLIRRVCDKKGWDFKSISSREEMLTLRGESIDILAIGWCPQRSTSTAIAIEATSKGFFPGQVAVWFDIHEYALGKPTAIVVGAVEYCQLPKSPRNWGTATEEHATTTLSRVLAESDHYTQLDLHGVFAPNRNPENPLFKNMVESSAVCMLATDPDGQITTVNLSGLTLFGYVPAEVAGLPYRVLFSPDVTEAEILDMHEVVMHSEGWEGEFRYCQRNGNVFPGWTAVSRIWSPGGDFQGLVFTIRDITREKELERQNREMQLQILHSQKMESVGVLAGGIAHDFNNLLVGVLGYSSKIRTAMSPDDPFYEDILRIESSAERAAQLTKSLLAFSRNSPKNLRTLNLNQIIKETLRILRPSFPATVEIETCCDERLWSTEVDAGQMQQALMNLCINARDAMPHGGTLRIETQNQEVDEEWHARHPGTRHGKHVCLGVSDTGTGIPTENQERIFDPFFTTKPIGQGTGLGLPVVYGIVNSHGGFVEVVSTPGVGSTFTLYLPASDKTPESALEKAFQTEGGTEHILLVDDETTIRRLGTEILSAAGYTVRTAANGVEALEIYKNYQEEIDLILLDLTMPTMSGEVCLGELRLLDTDIPIVVSSGYNIVAEDGGSEIEGATAFLQKPYRAHELVSMVRKVLDSCSKEVATVAARRA